MYGVRYHLKYPKHTLAGAGTSSVLLLGQCSAKIILSAHCGRFYPNVEQAMHVCNAQIILTDTSTEIRGDVKDEMKLLVEAKALANMTASAYQIADSVLQEIHEKYKGKKLQLSIFAILNPVLVVGYAGLTRTQLRDYVYHVRSTGKPPSDPLPYVMFQLLIKDYFYVSWLTSILKQLVNCQELSVRFAV